MLPFSDACERNKGPILEILLKAFARSRQVLEIGSGTGQHAVHLARNLPHLSWQPTDLEENLPGLRERIRLEGTPNLVQPLALDVGHHPWPVANRDALFSANTLHIMSWPLVGEFFRGVGEVLASGGVLAVYGPFRYRNAFTTESNAQFDRHLRQRDPQSGIRDFEAVDALARAQGLALVADHAMPANNQLLIWQRRRVPQGD